MAYPDFTTIRAIIAGELHEPDDDLYIGRYISQALAHFRHMRFAFSEKATTITLIASTNKYKRGGGVVPGDVLAIDNLQRLESGGGILGNKVRPVGIDEFRMYETSGSATSGQPDIYCWFEETLYLWPTPGEAYQCKLDYHIDATVDETTGNAIDPDAATHLDTHTNEFFRRGRELLKARVIYSYARMRSHDDGMIGRATGIYHEALSSLMGERDILKMTGRKVKSYWGAW